MVEKGALDATSLLGVHHATKNSLSSFADGWSCSALGLESRIVFSESQEDAKKRSRRGATAE
jgi:hypothetical protein